MPRAGHRRRPRRCRTVWPRPARLRGTVEWPRAVAGMKLIAVLTTTASQAEAQTIASALVERQLAACVQISAIESVYRWQGDVRHEPEFRLLVKTVESRYAAVESAIRQMHSYALPAIYCVPIEQAYVPYVAWVQEASADPDPPGAGA
jgi:periplasmic divalent cation tolerance protein